MPPKHVKAFFITIVKENLANCGQSLRIAVNSCPIRAAFGMILNGFVIDSFTFVQHVLRPTLKIFLFPLTLPCFNGMGRAVGFFIFDFSNWIPIKLNCVQ